MLSLFCTSVDMIEIISVNVVNNIYNLQLYVNVFCHVRLLLTKR